jgi:hypothetical protein
MAVDEDPGQPDPHHPTVPRARGRTIEAHPGRAVPHPRRVVGSRRLVRGADSASAPTARAKAWSTFMVRPSSQARWAVSSGRWARASASGSPRNPARNPSGADPHRAVDGPEQLPGLPDRGAGVGVAAHPRVHDRQPDQAIGQLETVPGPSPGADGLLGVGDRAVPVAGDEVPEHDHPQDPGHPTLVPRPAEQLQALLQQSHGGVDVASGSGHERLVVQRLGDAGRVAEVPLDGQGLLVEPSGGRDVLLPPGHPTGSRQDLGPGLGRSLPRRPPGPGRPRRPGSPTGGPPGGWRAPGRTGPATRPGRRR